VLPPRVNTGQLITFYYVAKEASFSVAAEQLYLSQSAVTQQIIALERDNGVKLINVKRKRVYLTETGSTLFRYAEEIYNQVRDVEALFQNVKERSLRVGVSTALSSFVAAVAVDFMGLYPNIEVTLKNGPSRTIVRELSDMRYQIAIVLDSNHEAFKLSDIRLSDRERLVLVCGSSMPIPATNGLSFADLREYQFLLPPEGSVARELLLKRFEAEGLEMGQHVLLQANYLECSKRFAEKGRGIILLPEFEVQDEVAQGKLRILHLLEDITVGVSALFPSDVPLSLVAKQFIQLIKKAFLR
jgi:DNA-binding transcriptional LysR family regulator